MMTDQQKKKMPALETFSAFLQRANNLRETVPKIPLNLLNDDTFLFPQNDPINKNNKNTNELIQPDTLVKLIS